LEAKNRLSDLIQSAMAGEEVVIADRGRAVIRLVPIGAASVVNNGSGRSSAILDWLHTHPLRPHRQCLHAWIETSLAQERAAWD
jgi:antitoxin (DNA-binding transcriptional repressor) of toxin-antitoxin stability system